MMNNTTDAALVAGLTTSPWWVEYLSQFNLFLTTFTLTAGLILGLLRMWSEGRRILAEKNGDA
ncbi:hypothetical protein [Elstera cyanobacteriorum]|uniref:hypothetical protein n=1 Tax=Elstera cyanobacteriorum TaxID=2022747 RepID=UPI0023577D13|nr:hypothetical protein [Elstera cyanobacteriorum]MCK6444409.1 hypothetical protein [Elstera cyanobacteriorum]